jgi:hypothetical protein
MATNSDFVEGLMDDGLLARDADESVIEALDALDAVSQAALRLALEQVKSYMPGVTPNVLI